MTNHDVTVATPSDDTSPQRPDQSIAEQLVDQAKAEGKNLVGPGGLLSDLTKQVLETGLEVEMEDHLGYAKHASEGRNGGNSRNGSRSKTVITEVGPVDIDVQRDRDGSFEPKTVRKNQRRLDAVDSMVISLTAKGLTTGEVEADLAEVYSTEITRETISKITDRVLDELGEWQNRPLDRVYSVIFIDAIVVKISDGQVANRLVYAAIGVTIDGKRDILGLWVGSGGEGAKYWLQVLTEIKNRGVDDACIVVCDGLKGLPEAIEATWPLAVVQTCVLLLIRTALPARVGRVHHLARLRHSRRLTGASGSYRMIVLSRRHSHIQFPHRCAAPFETFNVDRMLRFHAALPRLGVARRLRLVALIGLLVLAQLGSSLAQSPSAGAWASTGCKVSGSNPTIKYKFNSVDSTNVTATNHGASRWNGTSVPGTFQNVSSGQHVNVYDAFYGTGNYAWIGYACSGGNKVTPFDCKWDLSNLGGVSLPDRYPIAAHEWGHAYGLAHTWGTSCTTNGAPGVHPKAVMYGNPWWVSDNCGDFFWPYTDDQNGAHAIY